MPYQLGVGAVLTSYLHLEVFIVDLTLVALRRNCPEENLI